MRYQPAQGFPAAGQASVRLSSGLSRLTDAGVEDVDGGIDFIVTVARHGWSDTPGSVSKTATGRRLLQCPTLAVIA